MRYFILISLVFISSWAMFGPNIRVDHENRSNHACNHAAITLGPADPFPQSIYVAFQNDSVQGIVTVRSDIYFQKSTDGGLTFQPEDILIKRGAAFACYPDITADRQGNIYIVYTERLPGGNDGHFYCVRSSDQGNSWSNPARIDDNSSAVMVGWARIAVDTAGHLFVAWNDKRLSYLRIWSSVSTDQGVIWSTNVRVDDDTVSSDCFHPDVWVHPSTNFYMVTASCPYYIRPGYIGRHVLFTKSTNQGITFNPTFFLDTFSNYCGQPHVIADREYIICDYTGRSSGNQNHTQSRTSSTGDTIWNPPVPVTQLDSTYSSYYNGAKLAIDPQGKIHTALMVCPLFNYQYEIYYAYSINHASSWSERERVNDITSEILADPDVGADNRGFAYVLWQDARNARSEIWFATNRPLAIAEQNSNPLNSFIRSEPTVFRDKTLFQIPNPVNEVTTIYLYNSIGLLVRKLASKLNSNTIIWNGSDNSGNRCPPGIYIIKAEREGTILSSSKVVLLP